MAAFAKIAHELFPDEPTPANHYDLHASPLSFVARGRSRLCMRAMTVLNRLVTRFDRRCPIPECEATARCTFTGRSQCVGIMRAMHCQRRSTAGRVDRKAAREGGWSLPCAGHSGH